jgi:hypothetical protein
MPGEEYSLALVGSGFLLMSVDRRHFKMTWEKPAFEIVEIRCEIGAYSYTK